MRLAHLRIRIAPVLLLNLLTSVNMLTVPPVPLVVALMAVCSQTSLMTSGEKTYIFSYVTL